LFGDVLSDEAAILAGSLGMLPSAQLAGSGTGGTMFGFYESSHGSAPTLAGKNVANPIATVLSVSMMLRYTFGLTAEADLIDRAIESTLNSYRTEDIMEEGQTRVGTREMGDLIAEAIAAA
ncbi:MAG: 3-isopropylmalate dehydrogenase, partial [Dehalococcoidia bacterium]|nr:3-isopropylmalate dehydrogenase [Dehalococcoidia bacterium]